MSAATLDTLYTARDLEAAGIECIHAEAINLGNEHADTKADFDVLESRIFAKARRIPCQGAAGGCSIALPQPI